MRGTIVFFHNGEWVVQKPVKEFYFPQSPTMVARRVHKLAVSIVEPTSFSFHLGLKSNAAQALSKPRKSLQINRPICYKENL
jgi:hypothetical protein